MNNTKLIQLLKTFTLHEFNEFGKFINSPFHNESQMMILFYNYLKNHYPDFNSSDFTKENIFNKLYGAEKYDDKKIRDRFSDMLGLAENYLTHMDLRYDPYKFRSHTLNQFMKRNLVVHFNKKAKETEAVLNKKSIIDIDYFYDIYRHYQITTDFFEHDKLMGKRKSRFEEMATEVELFLRFVLTQMLSYYILMKDKEGILNCKFEYQLYEPVMKFVDENNFDDNPLLKLFALTLRLKDDNYDSNNKQLYDKTKQLFTESANLLEVRDKITISTALHNIAIKNFMEERVGFEREPFEILQMLLEYEAYTLEDGWMSREMFCNGVTIPLTMNEIEWAENFVKYYTVRVAPSKRENAQLYVNALLDCAKKKYDSAVNLLAKIKGKDLNHYADPDKGS